MKRPPQEAPIAIGDEIVEHKIRGHGNEYSDGLGCGERKGDAQGNGQGYQVHKQPKTPDKPNSNRRGGTI